MAKVKREVRARAKTRLCMACTWHVALTSYMQEVDTPAEMRDEVAKLESEFKGGCSREPKSQWECPLLKSLLQMLDSAKRKHGTTKLRKANGH